VPVWDELKVVLARLQDQLPGALMQSPMPEVDEGRHPPFTIHLAAWAAAAAEALHHQFGDNVDLTVGALPYPPGRLPQRPQSPVQHPRLLDPRDITAALDGPAVVRSGHVLRHGLLLHNLTSHDLEISGEATAAVVDPQSGEIVGGFSGFRSSPPVVLRVAPKQTGRVPMLIGTASLTPRLGYAVPAGDWGIQATLILDPGGGDSPRRRTPILPLTITA